jgi:NADPH:quinone reductase-like Zn-dependent oxidoreductase
MTTRKTVVPLAQARPSTAEARTMKAISQDTYGEADRVLRLADIDRPTIGHDEVLVKVRAAGVDPGTWHLVTGLPYVIRLAGFGVRAPKTRVRGLDLAGRVVAVGKDVTRLRPGDEVFGIGEGAFAEYARAKQDKLAPRPKNLTTSGRSTRGIVASTAARSATGLAGSGTASNAARRGRPSVPTTARTSLLSGGSTLPRWTSAPGLSAPARPRSPRSWTPRATAGQDA